MTRHFPKLAALLALLALGALFLWLPSGLLLRPVAETEKRHEPDYIIEKFVATAMDEQGRLKHELRASRLEHFADDDSMELEQPYLIQYSPDAPPLHTRADRGSTRGEGKDILMRGNVRMTRGPAGTSPAGEVVAQEMRVLLQ
jgi:lipopolysaccharide export system protein LptC